MKKLTVVFMLLLTLCLFPAFSVSAGSLDDLGQSGDSQSTESTQEQKYTDESGLVDYMNGYTPITNENMEQAQGWSQPIVKFIGTVTSFIILITVSLMFLTTALDLLYISFPPVRGILNPEANAQPAGGGMGAMGGMGMRGGMMGGMGGGAQPSAGGRKWISDEAVAAYQMTQPQQGGGMMGGGMMGGMGAMGGAQAQPASTKSAIFTYLKKRMFFLIVYGITTVVLFSSVLMGFGANIGVFILNIFGKLTGNL